VRAAVARAAVIGAVAPEKVDRIRSLYPGKDVRFTPNSVDVSAWELLAPDRARRDEVRAELARDGRRVVGLFGEMKFKKRAPLWLAALRDAGLVERVGLLVVGRLDEETMQILDDPALAPLHHRIPFCSQDKLAGLYAACDFVVLPSLFEGMPNVLLEAMAAGAVPIASNTGAMPAVIEHGKSGFLFPAEDRAGAAEVTAQALSLSDTELTVMSQAARARVAKEFSPQHELEIISRIVSRRPGKGEENRPG
jgi:glycosyltransferase involved in cell wall biosynthesis